MSASRSHGGMTLLELVIAMGLAAVLLLSLISIASAASSSTRLQRNQAQIQEHARLAVKTLSAAIRETGFTPQPWSESFPPLGLGEATGDSVLSGNDRLAVRAWSDLNCFGNRNPDTDADGNPRFYIRETAFDLNSGKGLTRQCRYGPSLGELISQVRRQGFVEGVESFQVLYAQDSDGDGAADGWVRAGEWSRPEDVLAVRVGLLLVSEESVADPASRSYEILDRTLNRKADGKLRRVVQFSAALAGRAN